MKVQIRPINRWKEWGVIGFILFGAAYASTAFSGRVDALAELTDLLNTGITFGAAATGALLSTCVSTIKYRCQMISAKNNEYLAKLINDENVSAVTYSGSPVKTLDIEKELQTIQWHAANCNDLISRFSEALFKISDLSGYIAEAKVFKDHYLKYNPEDRKNYLEQLRLHGYKYESEPIEFITNKLHELATAKKNPADYRSPIVSPPDSPNAFSLKFDNQILNSIGSFEGSGPLTITIK